MRTMSKRLLTTARGRGMALPTALLVLVVLTLLGTAAVYTSSTELDIAGNSRQELHSLSVAEAGIHEALARLNMKTGAEPQIIPAETSPGVPDPNWSLTVVNKSSLAANERQTLTGAFGSTTALPITTTVRYKIEQAGEAPVQHCNSTSPPCNGEVVRFHTAFGYAGTNVPTGAQVGPPVLRLESTYSGRASKTVVVEAVRAISQVSTPGTIRACGDVQCTGSNTTDGTAHPNNVAIFAGGTATGCDASHVDPDPGTTSPSSVQSGQGCPINASDPEALFRLTFGMSKADMERLADIKGTAPYPTPSGVDGKIIYVKGTAQSSWQGNASIGCGNPPTVPPGTNVNPVIVIFEGDFRIQGNVKFCGVLYVMRNFTIGAGTPKIYGAVISEGTTTLTLTGNSYFAYNPNVMNNINKLSPFTTILWKVN